MTQRWTLLWSTFTFIFVTVFLCIVRIAPRPIAACLVLAYALWSAYTTFSMVRSRLSEPSDE